MMYYDYVFYAFPCPRLPAAIIVPGESYCTVRHVFCAFAAPQADASMKGSKWAGPS